jgi:flagellar protein FlgJ
MNTLSASAVPVDLIKPLPTTASAVGSTDATKRAAITKTSKDYEASFVSSMLGQMFDGVETSAPFGGGEGEKVFKSFLMDAFGKQITKAGGIGIAASVQREMLKLQGLS